MIAKQPAHKLFFALWPDAAARQAMACLQQPLRGRLIPPEKLEVTVTRPGVTVRAPKRLPGTR